MLKLILNVVVCLIMFGCAASRPLGQIPQTNEDFNLTQKALFEKYPEIPKYTRDNWFFGYCTPIEDIISAWGEPKEKHRKWASFPASYAPLMFVAGGIQGGGIGTGIALAMFPQPTEIYLYEKGKYKIRVTVDKSFYCGYKTRLWLWEWEINEK